MDEKGDKVNGEATDAEPDKLEKETTEAVEEMEQQQETTEEAVSSIERQSFDVSVFRWMLVYEVLPMPAFIDYAVNNLQVPGTLFYTQYSFLALIY